MSQFYFQLNSAILWFKIKLLVTNFYNTFRPKILTKRESNLILKNNFKYYLKTNDF